MDTVLGHDNWTRYNMYITILCQDTKHIYHDTWTRYLDTIQYIYVYKITIRGHGTWTLYNIYDTWTR